MPHWKIEGKPHITLKEYEDFLLEMAEDNKYKSEHCPGTTRSDIEERIFYRASYLAFDKMYKTLKYEVINDVTLKEVKEMCLFHFRREGCEKCPMHATAVDCLVFNVPTRWGIDVIQKRMKEVRNETQEAQ